MTTGTEIPQADRLDLVRRLVSAVSKGGVTSIAAAALKAHLAPRYAGYAAQAARQLGLLETESDGTQSRTRSDNGRERHHKVK